MLKEFTCTKCGKRETVSESKGYPNPGRCPKNNNQEHTWIFVRNH